MKSYLIDSDILIDFFKKKLEAINLIGTLCELSSCAISVVAVAELRSGWTKQEALMYLPRLYNIFEVIPLTSDTAELAGQYRQSHSKKGATLPTIDALIAATAVLNNYCLVTRNIKHYPIPELDLYQEIY